MKKFFSFLFGSKQNKQNQAEQATKIADHVYSVKELQNLYDDQSNLNQIERDVLRLAMWDRARRAGYHGYAKMWGNIQVANGVISVLGLVNGVTIEIK